MVLIWSAGLHDPSDLEFGSDLPRPPLSGPACRPSLGLSYILPAYLTFCWAYIEILFPKQHILGVYIGLADIPLLSLLLYMHLA